MDELLGAIQQRKTKIFELNEQIFRLKSKTQLTQVDRSSIYATIRKLKEEEKNRSEKENWIVSIMRNTKHYNEEQMCHIFLKTNEIMKAVSPHFIELPYNPPTSLMQFLDSYYQLYLIFFQTLNQETQLKVSLKQSIKQGNVNLVTDLLKSLLAASRKQLRDFIEDLAVQVNRDQSPEKQKPFKKLAPDPLVENLRSRSSTQNGKKDGSTMASTLANSVIYNEEGQRLVEKNEKKEMQAIKDRLKQQKRLVIAQKIQSAYDFSPAESPVNNLRQKHLQFQYKESEKTQFQSIFANISPIMDDLDDQNIAVLDYQTIKRYSQNFEEFKSNFDSLCEKIRARNTLIQQSLNDYNQYAYKKTPECDFINLLRDKYHELTKHESPYHFCMLRIKPSQDQTCKCSETHSKSCHQNSSIQSPIKGKIIIRKSVQCIKKQQYNIIKQNVNTFTTKNLIEQIKRQKAFNQTIVYEDQSSLDVYRPNHQNSPSNKQANQTILQIRRIDAYNPVQQYKLYAHRMSNETPQMIAKTQSRAQSANAQHQLKYLTCSGYLEQYLENQNRNLNFQGEDPNSKANVQQPLLLTKSAA